MAGVHVYLVTPYSIPEENRKRLLVHVHGGAYVFFGGVAATGEAILMAHYAKTEVLSIDYRMPPDFPFPAAIDDSVVALEGQLDPPPDCRELYLGWRRAFEAGWAAHSSQTIADAVRTLKKTFVN